MAGFNIRSKTEMFKLQLILLEYLKLNEVALDNKVRVLQIKRRVCMLKIRRELQLQMQILASLGYSKICKLISNGKAKGTFWEIESQMNSDAFFKQNYRMYRATFSILCEHLRDLERNDSHYRQCIPLEKRVAIALYALGSSAQCRSIGSLFGVSKSTVCRVLKEFCHIVWEKLYPIYFNCFPLRREKVMDCVKGFAQLGFPQCMGVIDGCHIAVRPSVGEASGYLNGKGWHSTVLVALVDYRQRFLYINVGAPGRCDTSSVYQISQLRKELENNRILDEMAKPLSGVEVPVGIIADSTFKLSKRVRKPYSHSQSLSNDQKIFNSVLSKSSRVVDFAFDKLKRRFIRIGKVIDNNMKTVNSVIKACCVLHNFLSDHNDHILNHWSSVLSNEHPTANITNGYTGINSEVSAEEIRRAIAAYLGEGNANRELEIVAES